MRSPLRSSLCAVVVLSALGWAPGAAWAGDHPVGFPADAEPAQYTPSSVEAAVGDTVTFTGAFASHPLVWSDGDFTVQTSGTTRSYTFAKPGNFTFHCAIHASMFGNVHVPGNQFATPTFTWGPASPETGQTVTFTPGAFSDPDGTIARYEWDLNGDGVFETIGVAPSHSYATAGTYSVGLRYVDDGHEASSITTHALAVAQGAAPPPPPPGSPPTSPTPPSTPTKPGSPSPPSGSGGTGGSTTAPGGDDQGAGPSSGDTTAPRVRLGARALKFHAGKATASVNLSAAGVVKATLKRGTVVLATGTATLRAGDRVIHLTLTKAGVRALRRVSRVGVHATLTVAAHRVGSKKSATVKRVVTVKLA
jgi:plastocyanin